MKTILLTATYLVGIGELILAVFFWVTHSKSEIRKVMALLALSTGMWAITNAFTSYTEPSPWVDWNLKITFFAGTIIVSALVHFAAIFPYRHFQFDRLHTFLLYLPAILLGTIVLTTNTIVSSYIVGVDNPGYLIPGPLFSLFQIVISAYYIVAVGILMRKIRRLDGMHKINTKLILFGIALGGLPAVILNLWFAFFGSEVNPLIAVFFSIFWVGFTTYIIIKK